MCDNMGNTQTDGQSESKQGKTQKYRIQMFLNDFELRVLDCILSRASPGELACALQKEYDAEGLDEHEELRKKIVAARERLITELVQNSDEFMETNVSLRSVLLHKDGQAIEPEAFCCECRAPMLPATSREQWVCIECAHTHPFNGQPGGDASKCKEGGQ